MKRKYKIMLVSMGAVAIIAAAAATSAFAASRAGTAEPLNKVQATQVGVPVAAPTDADYQAWGCPMANDNYEAVAKLLGITTQELEAQLEQGKSLLEIAAAKGVSEGKLVATILAPMKDFMQQQVTSGKWTQAQLDARLKLAEQHIRQLVNAKGDADNDGGCGGAGMMGSTGNGTAGAGMMGGYQGGTGGMMGGYRGGTGGMMGGTGRGTTGGGMMGGGYGGMMGGNWN